MIMFVEYDPCSTCLSRTYNFQSLRIFSTSCKKMTWTTCCVCSDIVINQIYYEIMLKYIQRYPAYQPLSTLYISNKTTLNNIYCRYYYKFPQIYATCRYPNIFSISVKRSSSADTEPSRHSDPSLRGAMVHR